ncbi:MAG: DUF962 domain-containing protein [Gammaproteobacteria bacterium]|jgi:hypothetical protein
MTFYEELQQQRWDDHRYYHQSRVNQALHLLSAMSFLSAYVLLFINPVAAVLMGWIVAMCLRQVGHFFFEPKDYDKINQATHEHKEQIKVGYNLRRKVVLLSIWIVLPAVLFFEPTFFGVFEAHTNTYGYLYNLSVLWLVLGAGALVFRTVHLFFLQNVKAGLVWFTKILTDPFHDIKMYYKSPFYLLKGEMYDPMTHVHS